MGGLNRDRWVRVAVLGALLAVAVWLAFVLPSHRVFRLTLVLVYAVAVLGLGLATGFNGQISLGHGAFFGLGAYASAILTVRAGWSHPLTLLPAAALTFVVGAAVGLLTRRIRGLYLAVVTLVLAVATPPVLKRFAGLTGGAMGLSSGRPRAPAWTGLTDDRWMYLIALAVLVATLVLARNLIGSRVGRAIVAIREDERAARTMGVDVARVKAVTFGWSAMFAGVGGVLFAWTFGYVSPDSFGFRLSIEMLVMLVVGGMRSIWGPLLGVVALRLLAGAWVALFGMALGTVAPEVARAPGIAYGALVIVVMLVAPGGIAGWGRRLRERLAGDGPPGLSGPRGRQHPAG